MRRSSYRGESVPRAVDVRRLHLQLQFAALVNELVDLVGVVHVRGQHGGHEGGGVMGLQPGRLVGDQRIGGRVRLVEAVTGEGLHLVEDEVGQVLLDAARHRALDEDDALLGHLGRLFLAHGAAQDVGGAQRVAGQHLRDLHHLFLVQDHAVGRPQNRLQRGMRVTRRLPAVLAVDVGVDHAGLQRAGAEQGHQGDDFVEAVGHQFADQVLHAAGFELEHGGGPARLQQLEGGRVVHRQLFQFDGLFAGLPPLAVDRLHGPVDDRQRAQAEEVELDQADGFHVVLVELGDDAAAADSQNSGEKSVSFDGAMTTPPACLPALRLSPFERHGEIENGARVLLLLVAFSERRFFLDRGFPA
jgi:hypothetical protein